MPKNILKTLIPKKIRKILEFQAEPRKSDQQHTKKYEFFFHKEELEIATEELKVFELDKAELLELFKLLELNTFDELDKKLELLVSTTGFSRV